MLAVVVAATGLAMLALFATSPGLNLLNARSGAILLLLATFGMGYRPWRELGRHPVVRVLLLFTIYVVIQAAITHWRMPSIRFDAQLAAASKPLKLLAWACLIGWWLVERPRWVVPMLSLLLLGFAGWVAIHVPWNDLGAMLSGHLRLRAGYAENLVGLFSAVAVLIVSLFLVGSQARGGPWLGGLRRVLLGLALVLFGAYLLFAQSRGAWLALLLVLPGSVYWVRRRHGNKPLHRKFWPTIMALLLIGTSAGIYLAQPAVLSRFDHGPRIVHALRHDLPGSLMSSSVGLRLDIYRFGLRKWAQAPLLGWGLLSIHPMLKQSGIHLGSFVPPHLHDIYLQTAVGLGGIGLLLLLSPFAMWLRDLWLAWMIDRDRRMLNGILFGSLGIILIANLFDCLMWTNDYMRMPISLLLAGAMAVSLQRKRVEGLLSRPVLKVPHYVAGAKA